MCGSAVSSANQPLHEALGLLQLSEASLHDLQDALPGDAVDLGNITKRQVIEDVHREDFHVPFAGQCQVEQEVQLRRDSPIVDLFFVIPDIDVRQRPVGPLAALCGDAKVTERNCPPSTLAALVT